MQALLEHNPIFSACIVFTIVLLILWRYFSNAKQSLQMRIVQLETTLEAERKATIEKLSLLTKTQDLLSDNFKALSADALKQNSDSFLQLATGKLRSWQIDAQRRQDSFGDLVQPIRETLHKMEHKLETLEKERSEQKVQLTEQLNNLVQVHQKLQGETAQLTRALRAPHVRGKWGEVQLKRVVEMAGMLEHCDFTLQENVGEQDARRRPDMVLRLPGGKHVVIDAKTPLHAYLESMECTEDTARLLKLKEHAKQLRCQIDELAKKNYWDQFQSAPEFVVLFIPGENFFSAALEQDPTLIERGVDQRVILATPTTLIALLRAVAYGWRQEQATENANKICQAGRQLYERIALFSEHLNRVKKGLEGAIGAYNDCVGSYERRVIASARKLQAMGVGTEKDLAPPDTIDTTCRQVADIPMEEAQLELN